MQLTRELTEPEKKEIARAIRKIVVGLIVAEYGLMSLREVSKQDLKERTKTAISAIKRVQQYFINSPDTPPAYKDIFKREFVKSEIYMISELIATVWGLNDDSLEEIINAIKNHTEEPIINS